MPKTLKNKTVSDNPLPYCTRLCLRKRPDTVNWNSKRYVALYVELALQDAVDLS